MPAKAVIQGAKVPTENRPQGFTMGRLPAQVFAAFAVRRHSRPRQRSGSPSLALKPRSSRRRRAMDPQTGWRPPRVTHNWTMSIPGYFRFPACAGENGKSKLDCP